MVHSLMLVLVLGSALGCGLVAGIFFAFSTFIMRALAQLPPAQGIAAMQSINVAVLNRWFLATFFGTAACCLVLVVSSFFRWPKPGALWMCLGGLLYLAGTILVTMVFNVPRNDGLATVDPNGPDAGLAWARYVKSWTAWNHVRTAAALVAAASFSIALCQVSTQTSGTRSLSKRSSMTLDKPEPKDCFQSDLPHRLLPKIFGAVASKRGAPVVLERERNRQNRARSNH